MKINGIWFSRFLMGTILVGCTTTPPRVATPPESAPVVPSTLPSGTTESPKNSSQKATITSSSTPVLAGGPWAFVYTPGIFTYSITDEGQITALSDSVHPHLLPVSTHNVTLAIAADGNIQLITPSVTAVGPCDSLMALAVRAAQIIPKIPTSLTAGMSWSDSITVDGCRGTVPATTNIARTYTVVGDTVIDGVKTLQVQRSSTSSVTGEGSEGQHRVLLFGASAGNASLFFDTATGRFLGSTSIQTSNIEIRTSGRTNRFLQRVTERIKLATP